MKAVYGPARYCASLALAALASLILMVPQSTARSSDTRAGCGILVDAAHRWHSRTPDAPVESGDHWVVARNGRMSRCAFTRATVHRLLAAPARTYRGGHSGPILGGYC